MRNEFTINMSLDNFAKSIAMLRRSFIELNLDPPREIVLGSVREWQQLAVGIPDQARLAPIYTEGRKSAFKYMGITFTYKS